MSVQKWTVSDLIKVLQKLEPDLIIEKSDTSLFTLKKVETELEETGGIAYFDPPIELQSKSGVSVYLRT